MRKKKERRKRRGITVRKGLRTLVAVEALTMPVFAQSFDGGSIRDGTMALATSVSKQLVVMLQSGRRRRKKKEEGEGTCCSP